MDPVLEALEKQATELEEIKRRLPKIIDVDVPPRWRTVVDIALLLLTTAVSFAAGYMIARCP